MSSKRKNLDTTSPLSIEAVRVLVASEYTAGLSAKAIGAASGVPARAVREQLERLTASGVIAGKTAILDLSGVGLTEYSVYLDVGIGDISELSAAAHRLARCSGVSWVGIFSGMFNLGVSIFAASPRDVGRLLDDATTAAKVTVRNKWLTIRDKTIFFPRKYLTEGTLPKGELVIGIANTRSPLDGTEQRILQAIVEKGIASDREIARTTRIPQSTVSRKIRGFERSGIIAGYMYRYHVPAWGQVSRVLLLRVAGKQRMPDVLRFAAKHPHIVQYSHVTGSWDVELQFDFLATSSVPFDADVVLGPLRDGVQIVGDLELRERSYFCAYPFK